MALRNDPRLTFLDSKGTPPRQLARDWPVVQSPTAARMLLDTGDRQSPGSAYTVSPAPSSVSTILLRASVVPSVVALTRNDSNREDTQGLGIPRARPLPEALCATPSARG